MSASSIAADKVARAMVEVLTSSYPTRNEALEVHSWSKGSDLLAQERVGAVDVRLVTRRTRERW